MMSALVSSAISSSSLAESTAARLRTLQSSGRHLDPENRKDYLAKELETLLHEIPASEKKAVLEEVRSFFPAFGSSGDSPPALVTPSSTDPTQLLTQLTQAAQSLGKNEQTTLASLLRNLAEDLDPQPDAPTSADLPDDLAQLLKYDPAQLNHLKLILTVLQKEKLDLDGERSFDLVNSMRLLALLTDRFAKIHDVFWTIFQASGNGSTHKKPEKSFREQAAAFLQANPSVSAGDFADSVELTGKLLAAFLSSVPDAARQLGSQILADIAPETIATAIRGRERSSLGLEAKYWKEFEYRCSDFTEAQLAEKLVHILKQKTQSLVS